MLTNPQPAIEVRPPRNRSPVTIGIGALAALFVIFGALLVGRL